MQLKYEETVLLERRGAKRMDAAAYSKDPCGASSLPFWKTECVSLPAHLCVLRDDAYSASLCAGADEPYFKLIHRLEQIPETTLPDGFVFSSCSLADYARHIGECYTAEGVDADELNACCLRPVYDPVLWIAVREKGSGRIVASGIGELDRRIGEGTLEWIQVSPEFRRRGLGQAVVCELLQRMRGKAGFVTVSGRVNNPDNPLACYLRCGFRDPVIWHVVTQAQDGTSRR